jgi:hypothetical protein
MKLQRTFDDVCELLVVMLMLRDDRALFQEHMREHDAVTRNQFAIYDVRYALERDFVPRAECAA